MLITVCAVLPFVISLCLFFYSIANPCVHLYCMCFMICMFSCLPVLVIMCFVLMFPLFQFVLFLMPYVFYLSYVYSYFSCLMYFICPMFMHLLYLTYALASPFLFIYVFYALYLFCSYPLPCLSLELLLLLLYLYICLSGKSFELVLVVYISDVK